MLECLILLALALWLGAALRTQHRRKGGCAGCDGCCNHCEHSGNCNDCNHQKR
ncbi:FeoB-associated Cys-rich membrane protein [Oscillibacter sp.]|uniref:FeoB-associated Cys-rich membrane protein n=1 Tax=Oscillibacter sp. TaxID=1945593 RepID=UPI0028AE9E13|nr:FeoB-associated Cys-rich membrane protein [Oscillibacter sp.]